VDVVCTDVGPGGGHLAGRLHPGAGSIVDVTMRPKGTNTPWVSVRGEVVYVMGATGKRPQGFGLRWISATSRTGAQPLELMLAELLLVRPRVPI
jgi:hypothetical protein